MGYTTTPLKRILIQFQGSLKTLFILGVFFLFSTTFAQTNFSGDMAPAFGIDIGLQKDGGFSFADFDLDGDLDLLVNTDQNKAFLLRRDGATFTDVTDALTNGMNTDRERCAIWADLNNDGYPDFIRNTSFAGLEVRLQDPNTNIFGDGNGGTAPFLYDSNNIANGVNTEAVGVLDYDNDGDLDIYFDNHDFGIDIIQNDGNGIFTHVTAKGPNYDVNVPSTWPLGIVQDATDGDYGSATDYNNDGYVDIISRKRDQVDFFTNNNGVFTEAFEIDQADNSDKGAVGFYDFDNDGDFDLIWTDNGDNAIYENAGGTFNKLPTAVTGIPIDFNDGNAHNIEGLAAGDVDNDGDIDLFFAGDNGYIFFNQINSAGGANTGTPFNFNGFDTGALPGGNGEGCNFQDIDDDGDLDLYININNAPNVLFLNQLETFNNAQADNFLFFDILEDRAAAGMPANTTRYAHGATIRLVDCDGNIISGLREVNGGNGHGTQDTPRVHFGLPTDINTEIIAEVFFPFLNGERKIVRVEIQPEQIGSTVGITSISASLPPNNAPTAINDDFTINAGDSITFNVLADNGNGADFDPDGDSLSVSSFSPVSDGTLEQNPDGTFTYTADPDFVGTATFTYNAADNGSCQTLALEDTATVTIVVVANPAIALVKQGVFNDENNDGNAQPNETITYTFTVTNPGDVSLGTIQVTDPLLNNGNPIPGPESGDTNGNNRLETNESWVYEFDYSITQADIDNGNVNNQATASGISPDPDNQTVTDLSDDNSPLEDDPTDTPLNQNPIIALVKNGVFQDENNNGSAQEGESILYTFIVTNPGNVSLDNVVLTDPLINNGNAISGPDSGDTNNDNVLQVDEVWVYTSSYTITQNDIDSGNVQNQALVTGTDPNNVTVQDNSDDDSPLEDDPTVTTLPQNPIIALVKTGVYNDQNGDNAVNVGDVINYTFSVTNEGDVTLTSLVLTDPLINSGNPIAGPDSGDTNNDGNLDLNETWVYTASYALSQSDIDARQVSNQALITSETPNGDPNNSNDDVTDTSDNDSPFEDDTTVTPLPGIAIVKQGVYQDSNSSGDVDPGDVIAYTFNVTNEGNIALANVTVTDPLIASITFVNGDTNSNNLLDLNETWSYSGSYTITQADIDAGNVENQATATGDDGNGNTVSDLSDDNSPLENEPTNTPLNQNPVIALVKTGQFQDTNSDGFAQVGETIDYTFTVTNEGNVSLTDIVLTDPLLNSGNPITGPDSGDINTDGILQVDESWIYTAPYTLTQSDIDSGSVQNQALVTANDPNNNPVQDNSDDNSPLEDEPTITSLPQNGRIGLVKTGTYNDTNNNSTVDTADIINYTFVVTNEGDATLTSLVLTDPLLNSGNPIAGPDSGDTNNDGNLDLDETWVYTATYSLTQSNIDDGLVTNQALVNSETLSGDPNDPNDDVSDTSDDNSPLENDQTITPLPSIAIVKDGNYADTNNNGIVDTADTINYTFTVTNEGNIALSNITVTDPLIANITFSGGDANSNNLLDLNESWTYTGSYTLTQSDISLGGVTNQATATGDDGNGNTVSDLSDDNSPLENEPTFTPIPNIAIIKTGVYQDANANAAADVGDTILYSFTVSNTGQTPLANIQVTDPLLNSGNPITGPDSGDTNLDNILQTDEVWTYSFTYALSQTDIDNGSVTNQATATGTDPNGVDVSDLSDDDSNLENESTITNLPSIAIIKTGVYQDANANAAADVGDTILYSFTVSNTGQTPLANVQVTDPLLNSGNPITGPDSGDTNLDNILQTDEVWTYSFTYALSQTDIDNGSVTNQATATGTDPNGVDVSDLSDDDSNLENESTITNLPSIAIIKTGVYQDANANAAADVGDTILYSFTVSNTGQTPLANVQVTDPLLNSGNPITGPDSGDTNLDNILQTDEVWTYSFKYALSQTDIDNGSVTNQATATGTDPNGVDVSDLSDDDSNLENESTITNLPGIAIIKTGVYEDANSNGQVDIGDDIFYTFMVTNEGNTALNNVSVIDPLLNNITFQNGDSNNNGLLDLNESWMYTGIYAITQTDINNGFVNNQATATGEDDNGTEVSDLSDDNSILENDQTTTNFPGIAIIKTGTYNDTNANDKADLGDTISYSFTVSNEGQTPLGNVAVTDPLINGGAAIPGPNSGDTNNDGILDLNEIWVYTASYNLTQSDIQTGNISNQATAVGTDPDGTQVTDLSDDNSVLENDTTNTPLPQIAIVKTGLYQDSNNNNTVDTSDNIEYTFTVTNEGGAPLLNVVVTDPLIDNGNPIPGPVSGDTNNDGILDLNEIWTYSALYPITQTDINAGNVTNQALATSNDNNGNTAQDQSDDNSPLEDDPTYTPLTQTPSIGLVKQGVYNDANSNGTVNVGDMINYNFTVTNTGNTSLSNVELTDILINNGTPIAGPDTGDTNNDGILDLDEVWMYSASYTLVQADVDNLSVSNQALVTADDPENNQVQDDSDDNSAFEDDVTITPLPAIAIIKTGVYNDANNNSMADVGDTIIYTFLVSNEGNSPLSNVIVTDPLLGGAILGPVSGDANNNNLLDLTETWEYSATYNLQQADINFGQVTNQAVASGDDPNGTQVMDDSDDNSPLENDQTVTLLPEIAIIKNGAYSDTDNSGAVSVGDSIQYTLTVTNEGQSPLSNVVVNDPLLGGDVAGPNSGDTNNDTILDLDEVWVYTVSYAITQDDIDTGFVTNQATATGIDPDNNSVTDLSDDDSVLENEPTITLFPGIAIIKDGIYEDSDNSNDVSIGDAINYTFTVTNTGETPLSNVIVTDPLLNNGNPISGPVSGDTNSNGVLELNETWEYTFAYSLSAGDIAAGSVTNQATASGDDPDGNTVTDLSDDNSPLENDETITLLPGIAIVKTGVYEDTDASGNVTPGDSILYTFTVTNSGQAPLSDVTVTDLRINGGAPIPGPNSGDLNNDSVLNLDEIWTYTASYPLTQIDINDGFVNNQALAEGEDENGTVVEDNSDDNSPLEDDQTITPLPAIAIVKTGNYQDSNADNTVNVGDAIAYTFTVTNPGEAPLLNVEVTDPLINNGNPIAGPDSGDTNNDGILDLNETWVYTSLYSITQLDINTGQVTNQALATGNPEGGDSVQDSSDDDSPLENDETITVFPGIAIVKTGVYVDFNSDNTISVGDRIDYSFNVTNTGEQPLSNVVVSDPLLGGPISGPDAGDDNNDGLLDTNETWVYSAFYTITQADIDNNGVTNQATATGNDPNGNTVTDISDDDSPLQDEPTNTLLPTIAIVKTGVYQDSNANSSVDTQDNIAYTFTVTNQGDVPLLNVTVTDPLIDNGNPIAGPDSGDTNGNNVLDLDETWTYTVLYPITQADIENGGVTNQATATGEDANGNTDSDISDDNSPLEDDETFTPLDQMPQIAVVKQGLYQDSDGTTGVTPGDVITYTFTVTNTGNVSLSNVILNDPLLGGTIPGPDSGDSNNDAILDLTETWVYSATYTITQQDINAGFVTNQAIATGTPPIGDPVSDDSDDDSPVEDDPTITPLDQTPRIAIVKVGQYTDANNDETVNIGDRITYSFTVTNQGNVPLSNVVVTDPLINNGNPIAGPDSGDINNNLILEQDETWMYSANYSLTQADIDAGQVTNQAIATGESPDGTPTQDESDDDSTLENDPTITSLPGIAIVKTGVYVDFNSDNTISVGDRINYSFNVTNTGEQPLSNVVVSDPLLGGPISGPDTGDDNNDGLLDTNETWVYSAFYTITQADIDNNGVTNQATATGNDPNGNTVTDISDDDSPLQDEPTNTLLPTIAIVKTGVYQDSNANSSVDTQDNIAYTFTVTNQGDVPLLNVTVTDPLIDNGNPIAGPDSGDTNGNNVLDLDETWTYTVLYPITQADIENGGVTNQATATGEDANGNTDSDISDDNSPLEDDETFTPLDQMPQIAVVKQSLYQDSDGITGVTPGDVITYTFTVTNTGNVSLSNVILNDPLLGGTIFGPDSGDSNNDAILDLTETWVYSATYTITQQDINEGFVTNQAIATGNPPIGDPVSDDSDDNSPVEDDPTITPLDQTPRIAIVKVGQYTDANNDETVNIGDRITYSFTVTNQGNVPLSNVVVTDPLINNGNPIAGPDSGDINNNLILEQDETWMYSANYSLTQADIDAGQVTNQAIATGESPDGTPTQDESDDDSTLENDPTITVFPGIAIVKTGVYVDADSSEDVTTGDNIIYTFRVTNTGNLPLSNITITDPLVSNIIFQNGDTNNNGLLEENEVWEYTATYNLTSLNVADLSVTNQATAAGQTLSGSSVSDQSDDNEFGGNDPTITPLPKIALIKTGIYRDVDNNGSVSIDDTIEYTFKVSNEGNTPLTDIILTDPLLNNGNPLIGPSSGDINNDGILDVSEVWTYNFTYLLVQSDIDAGSVTNQAEVTSTDPYNNPISDLSDDEEIGGDNPTITPLPGIAIVKDGVYRDSNLDTMVNIGDSIEYTFMVTNVGEAPLSNIRVTDLLLNNGQPLLFNGTGDINNDNILDLDETWIYTASYTLTSDDIAEGQVINQALVQGDDPNGTTVDDVSDDDSPLDDNETITILPNIGLVKIGELVDSNNDGIIGEGDVINYTFTVTNSSTIPLDNVILTDPRIDNGNPIAGPDSGDLNLDNILTNNETWVYTATYTITAADVMEGSVTNQATVTGETPADETISDMSDDDSPVEDDPTITLLPQPSIALVKTSVLDDPDNDGFSQVGDIITYTFTVTNTGTEPLANIELIDPLISTDPILGPDSGDLNNDNVLDLNEIWVYTATYALTQEDLNNEIVINTAVVTGTPPAGDPVSDISDNDSPVEDDETETPIRPNGEIALIKEDELSTADPDGFVAAGDIITYTFTVMNTGNVPLENVRIEDPLLDNQGIAITFVDGDVNNDSILDLDEVWTYTAEYIVTEDDVVDGSVTNEAIAIGTTPQGDTVSDDSDDNSPIEDEPTITVFESPPCELTRQDIKDGISDIVTPDENAMNQFLNIPNSENCNYIYGIMIFNRWGNKVYENRENYQNDWDGFSQNSFYGGDQLPSGTYYYVLEFRNANFKPITGYIFLGTK